MEESVSNQKGSVSEPDIETAKYNTMQHPLGKI